MNVPYFAAKILHLEGQKKGSICIGCREDVTLPFEFKIAFQPIVDMAAQRVWGYEALVRGVNGESAFSILSQVNDDIRYRFDQASRVMAIETAGALFKEEICGCRSISCQTRCMSQLLVFRNLSRLPSGPTSPIGI